MKLSISLGAEAIMDLSNYGKTHTFRQELVDFSPAMIGTVPMYDAIGYLEKNLADIPARDFLKVVEAHAKEGVDFHGPSTPASTAVPWSASSAPSG